MNEQEFEKKVQARLQEPKGGVDPSMNNGARRMPEPVDRTEIGRKAYERVKNNAVSIRLYNETKLKK